MSTRSPASHRRRARRKASVAVGRVLTVKTLANRVWRGRVRGRSRGGMTDDGGLRPLDLLASGAGLVEGGLHAAAVLGRARLVRPVRPDRPPRALAAVHRWGFTPAGGFAAAAALYPDAEADRRRARRAHLRRARRAHEPARERLLGRRRARGRRRRRDGPQPPRLRRGDRRAVQARRGRDAAQHRLRRAAADRGGQAREAARDRLRRASSPSCSTRRSTGARASSPGTTRRTTSPTRRSRS